MIDNLSKKLIFYNIKHKSTHMSSHFKTAFDIGQKSQKNYEKLLEVYKKNIERQFDNQKLVGKWIVEEADLPASSTHSVLSYCLHEIYRIPREEKCTAKQVAKLGFMLGSMFGFIKIKRGDAMYTTECNAILMRFVPFGFTIDDYATLLPETPSKTCTCYDE
jgi:hypothetical protein